MSVQWAVPGSLVSRASGTRGSASVAQGPDTSGCLSLVFIFSMPASGHVTLNENVFSLPKVECCTLVPVSQGGYPSLKSLLSFCVHRAKTFPSV